MEINLKPSSPFVRSLKNHPFLYWFLFTILVCAFLGAIGFFMSLIGLCVALAIYGAKKKEDKEIRRVLLVHEADKYIDSVKELKSLPTINPLGAIFLEKDEHLFLNEDVDMKETRSVRRSSGSFGGVRIMKGVTVGQYSGRSSSSLEWATLDNGSLYLTSKKLLFMGRKENRSIPLKKIVAVETFLDAVEITVDGRSKAIQFPVKNGYIWSSAITITKSVDDPTKIGDLKLDFKFE